MSHQIEVSDQELETIMTALHATVVSGGGSFQYTLYRKLSEQTKFNIESDEHLTKTNNLVIQVIKDWFETVTS